MPLAYWNGKTIGFAHVPKTGGTSVKDYLVRRFGPLSILDVNKRSGAKKTGLIVPADHLSKSDLAELLPHDLTYGFAVVRDPMKRLLSEYRFQSKLSRTSRLGFSTWLRVMIYATRMEPRLYENHIRPQTDLVPDNFEIFRLEDGFKTLISRLDEIAECKTPEIDIQHLNVRKSDEIVPFQKDITLLVEFYEVDYERFGYHFPEISQFPKDRFSSLRAGIASLLAPALVVWQRYRWLK